MFQRNVLPCELIFPQCIRRATFPIERPSRRRLNFGGVFDSYAAISNARQVAFDPWREIDRHSAGRRLRGALDTPPATANIMRSQDRQLCRLPEPKWGKTRNHLRMDDSGNHFRRNGRTSAGRCGGSVGTSVGGPGSISGRRDSGSPLRNALGERKYDRTASRREITWSPALCFLAGVKPFPRIGSAQCAQRRAQTVGLRVVNFAVMVRSSGIAQASPRPFHSLTPKPMWTGPVTPFRLATAGLIDTVRSAPTEVQPASMASRISLVPTEAVGELRARPRRPRTELRHRHVEPRAFAEKVPQITTKSSANSVGLFVSVASCVTPPARLPLES